MSQNFSAMKLDPSLEKTEYPCIGCGGTGHKWCPKCHGTGEEPGSPDDPDVEPWPCTICGGMGFLGPCVNCTHDDDDAGYDPWLDEDTGCAERLSDAVLDDIPRRP